MDLNPRRLGPVTTALLATASEHTVVVEAVEPIPLEDMSAPLPRARLTDSDRARLAQRQAQIRAYRRAMAERTPADLQRVEKAQRTRELKAAKRRRQMS